MLAALFAAVLVAAAIEDIKTRRISNRYSAAIFLLALGSVFTMPQVGIASRCVGALCISVPMLVLAWCRPGAFGGGDIKLMAAGGIFLGWKGVMAAMLLAIMAGGVVCLTLLLTKRKRPGESIAFGPFLCFGLILALILGDRLWEWILVR